MPTQTTAGSPVSVPACSTAAVEAVAAAREHVRELVRARMFIGAIPPSPATIRGRIGAVLVRLVRRALFWLMPQLDRFHEIVIAVAECELKVMEEALRAIARVEEELTASQKMGGAVPELRTELQSLREMLVDFGEALEQSAADTERQNNMEVARWISCVQCRARVEQDAAGGPDASVAAQT